MTPYTLWDGINTATISGDELNGGGVNATVDVDFFEAAQVFMPLVAPSTWWDDIDLCVRRENRATTVRPEKTLLCVGDD